RHPDRDAGVRGRLPRAGGRGISGGLELYGGRLSALSRLCRRRRRPSHPADRAQAAGARRAAQLRLKRQDQSARMNFAARSAVAIAGALVLPDTSVGKIEVSTTRSPSTPRTLRRISTTDAGSDPIRQVPQTWKAVEERARKWSTIVSSSSDSR